MIRALGDGFSRFAARWVPDPFSIALGLTFVTLLLCWATTGTTPLDLLGHWGGRLDGETLLAGDKGLWKLLTFGMQMTLILVTGHALASAPPVRRAVRALADRPRTPAQAVALVAVVAMAFAFLNWGLGLVVGALIARDVGRAAHARGLRVHYPLIGAAGYSGLLIWHGGLSGSAPLKVTQAKDIQEILGDGVATISLDATVLSPMNLTVTLALFVVVPLLLIRMQPRDDEHVVPFDPSRAPEEATPSSRPPAAPTPAERFEQSRLLAWAMAALAALYLWRYLTVVGVTRLDPNTLNLAFVALGLSLHASPKAYAGAIADATRGASGIVLQFPFYAGIMGMMALSGLVADAAQWMSSAATATSLSPLTFLSAGAVNLLVPSGGGQWAIQGPLVVQTAQELGVPLGKAVMAFAYGDQWTNMLQPFWALPLLGITGLEARELVGYTATLMLLVAPVFLIALLVF